MFLAGNEIKEENCLPLEANPLPLGTFRLSSHPSSTDGFPLNFKDAGNLEKGVYYRPFRRLILCGRSQWREYLGGTADDSGQRSKESRLMIS